MNAYFGTRVANARAPMGPKSALKPVQLTLRMTQAEIAKLQEQFTLIRESEGMPEVKVFEVKIALEGWTE